MSKLILLNDPKPQLDVGRLRRSTPVNAPAEGPLFETDVKETLAIRKFCEMSQFDLLKQLEAAARDPKLDKRQFLQMKQAAEYVTAWLTGVLVTVDDMLQSAKLKEDQQPSESN